MKRKHCAIITCIMDTTINLKFQKIFDLQNSRRTEFYRKYLSNSIEWISSRTILNPNERKEEFDKKSILERFNIQLSRANVNVQFTHSRIYIDDLVNIINASMNKPNPISIYNVADDLPSSLNDVVRYISEKTGIIIDREVQYSELSEDEKRESFFTENKKVNNKLIKEELGVILKYPTYIEGYNKIINC